MASEVRRQAGSDAFWSWISGHIVSPGSLVLPSLALVPHLRKQRADALSDCRTFAVSPLTSSTNRSLNGCDTNCSPVFRP